jgi:hypothetical protein
VGQCRWKNQCSYRASDDSFTLCVIKINPKPIIERLPKYVDPYYTWFCIVHVNLHEKQEFIPYYGHRKCSVSETFLKNSVGKLINASFKHSTQSETIMGKTCLPADTHVLSTNLYNYELNIL